MKLKAKLGIVIDRIKRPVDGIRMVLNHKRTIKYLLMKKGLREVLNFIFVEFFIRGEDCGKGILDPLWKFFPAISPYVWDIEVEVTTKCYLKCIMCERNYWTDKRFINKELSFENFKMVFDQFPNLKWVNLTGEGSPFLNKDFLKMIEYLKSRHVFVVFVHDFFYMTEELARQLISLGVDKLYVSIDGATPEVYNKIRVGSDFNKVIDNIKLFIKIKKEMGSPIPELGFRYTFFKYNYQDMSRFVDVINSLSQDLKDLGDEVIINFVSLLEFKQTKGWVYEPPKELIDSITKKGESYGIKVLWSHPSHNPEEKAPMHYCVSWTEPYIMIDGSVLPDCAVLMSNKRPFLKKYAFGNVFQKPFKEIWNSDRYRKFRSLVLNSRGKVPILCKGCRAFDTTFREKKYGVSKTI